MTANETAVKQKDENYHLFINGQYGPCVVNLDKTITQVPDSDYGRWWVCSHYAALTTTSESQAWLDVNNPTKLVPPAALTSEHRHYQRLAAYRMRISNCGLWFEQGLGKCFTSISYAMYLYQMEGIRHFLILCPTTIFVTWMDEIKKHILPKAMPQVVLAHGPKRKKELLKCRLGNKKNPVFIITTYETLNSIKKELAALNIGAIFADESAKIKNPTSARSKTIFELKILIPKARRFCLSGTPSTTKPLGYWAQLEWLGENFSKFNDFSAFEREYTKSLLFAKVELPNGVIKHLPAEPSERMSNWLNNNCPPESKKPEDTFKKLGYFFTRKHTNNPKALFIHHYYNRVFGVDKIPQLNRTLQAHSYTVFKRDVAKEIPEKIWQVLSIPLSSEQHKLYHEVLTTNKATLDGQAFHFSNRTSPHVKLHQIANGFVKHGDTIRFLKAQPKLNAILTIIENNPNDKIIIWSPYRAQIKQIVDFLLDKKIKTVQLHGDVPAKDRPAVVHTFEADARALVANPEAAGEGLNLMFSHVQIWAANWWKPDKRAQAEDRQHRIGQTEPVTIIDLITPGTLEKKLYLSAREKIQIENTILSMNDLTEGSLA